MARLISLATALALVSSAIGAPVDSKSSKWADLSSKITHVVYLMMENHSFDNIAGYWDFHPDINNLRKVDYCNEFTNPNWTIYDEPIMICASPYEAEVPLKDPDHNFAGVSYEIYRKWDPTNDDVPDMSGFIERQSDKYNATPGDSAFVIKAYDPAKSNTLATLAQNYAFWDSYYAEHPGPTNPNRMFATSGSSCGYVDNKDTQATGWFANVTGTTCATSVFEALSNKNISWKNYYESDIIDAYIYKWVQDNAMDRLVHADQFYEDLKNNNLPQFSYINPECCTVDSMHPTSNMAAGELMIKHLYDALRNSSYWDNVLLIINFDEHGGFADHVPPPTNIPAPQDGLKFSGASDGHNVTYDFTRLGVRVPAFAISPWIPPNTLIHDDGTMYASNSEYTHTSFLHFLQELWGLEGLNNRVQWAKTFEHVFSDTPQKDGGLSSLPSPVWHSTAGQPEPEAFPLLNQDYSYYAALDD
ncbi:hypothetical protein HRR83_006587 [Exophiala dermatitidis]|uniref:Phospholipase C n=2 Tax=Exophiala dermatitidis TaxID=5970 RepID=H6BWB6_EXODN|nr:phospholipase C [Exophiala dermatitidis NIH/UT8656]KAJ4511342.1 hypothetical protein HRR75_005267 [Exophiala dermatitidis]EHY56032.1 phospholipase C [Exophiala dermatitidis NIH/UT8656]KAJ4514089.1 hypothetical protein HRR74_005747 [Exophiala dermatitidis]KAJ4515428.1 hypothetical protein HRR73_005260 [Exophiala dermatitidis]KAJ4533738.1 hypothetical protein HRR77_008222 [Exophiala dermatitidis]